MNKTFTSSLTAAALLTAPAAALADRDAAYIGGYFSPTADLKQDSGGVTGSNNQSGDGLGIQGELPLGEPVVLTGEIQQLDFDNNDADQTRFGIGLVADTGSGVFAEYTRIDFGGGNDVDGPSIHARLGGDIREGFSSYGRIGYHFLSDDTEDVEGPEFAAGLEFNAGSPLGIYGEYRFTRLSRKDSDDDIDIRDLRLGVRWHF